jgi:hypothetical protein
MSAEEDDDGPSQERDGVEGTDADAAFDDPGTEIVGDIIALFLRDLADITLGAVENLRVRAERAGELLRQHGRNRQRAQRVVEYRVKLRRARKLVDRMWEVVEVGLPPE